jgi:hypothetical protein
VQFEYIPSHSGDKTNRISPIVKRHNDRSRIIHLLFPGNAARVTFSVTHLCQ